MKKLLTILLSMLLLVTGAVGLTACGGEKDITVVARTQGSGTREAFDTVVTDGNGNFSHPPPTIKHTKAGCFLLFYLIYRPIDGFFMFL